MVHTIAELEARNRQQQLDLNALLNAARYVLAHTSFQEAARRIFGEAKKITGATSGYVALLSEGGAENEVLFLDSGGLPCSVDPALPMPIRGLRADAYRLNKTVYENDFTSSRWAAYMPEGHVVLRNVLFSPLVLEGRTVGIMGLANKAGDFTEHDKMMATAFGEFAAVSLHNSRNLDKLNDSLSELTKALSEIKTLKGIIPICAKCKRIRDDGGYWRQVESYIRSHSDAEFSHGLCPDCLEEYMQDT